MTIEQLKIGQWYALCDFERTRPVKIHSIDPIPPWVRTPEGFADTGGRVWVRMPEGDLLDVDVENLKEI